VVGVDGDEVTEGIPDPYADQSPRIAVPEKVYTQEAPYDTSVVEIGEKVTLSSHISPPPRCLYMSLRHECGGERREREERREERARSCASLPAKKLRLLSLFFK